MVPVRVFRKISKYLKVSSSDKDKGFFEFGFFVFFAVYVAAADAGDGAAVEGVNCFFISAISFLFMWFTSVF